MSISGALANALTGLTANARAADVVSSNLANVHTDGYGRRDIELGATAAGTRGGVQVLGVTRHVDPGILGDRRLADGALTQARTRSAFLTQVQTSVGTPDQPGSISARIAALEAGLVTAASRPEAPERLQAVAQQAADLVKGFNAVSEDIQTARMRAEADIASAVKTLGSSLDQVRDLNDRIGDATRRRQDTSGLLDQRQTIVDRISQIVPVQEMRRDDGAVALVTSTGAILLEGRAISIDFAKSNVIAPHMRLENGLLSGLALDGETVSAAGPRSPIAGGQLAAFFEIRDGLAVTAQTRIDALARNLADRFQPPGLDSTQRPADPGLFTDAGARVDAAAEVGLAGRLALHPQVDPASGGMAWHLRDGLGATAPGPGGNAALLGRYVDAMGDRQAMPTGDFGTVAATFAVHAGALSSIVAQDQLAGDEATSLAASRQTGLQTMLMRDGVDTDTEMQRLMLIEQAYGANAKMIQALDEMMQTLLRM